MGRLGRKTVVFLAELTKNCKSGKKQLIMSCVSLFLATAVLVSSVYCWFALNEAKTSGSMSISASNGMRLNYNENNDNTVKITDNMKFLPASSVAGQNLYFPSDGSFFSQSDGKGNVGKTKELIYRAATAGDKDVYFLQFDFQLQAFADNTEVYIDETKTHIYWKGTSVPATAMRVAFLYDNGKGSVVMNPTPNKRGTDAVDIVNFGSGKCTKTKTQNDYPFTYYTAMQDHSLFTLKMDEIQKMSVVIWLEGTDSECTGEIAGKDLDINISFTTTKNDIDGIEFVDTSTDKWITELIGNGGRLQLVYTDSANTEQTFDMTGSGGKYTCRIKKALDSGISFRLTAADGKTYVWDTEPNGTPSTYRGKNVTYNALGTTTAPRGYWKTSDSDSDIGSDTPVDDW